MTDTLTLTETGIALILLEQELRNNQAEVARWIRREQAMRTERLAAEEHMRQTMAKIQLLKGSLR